MEINDDDCLYVVGGWTYPIDSFPGNEPVYTIIGVFDEEQAAYEAADLCAEQFNQYIEGIEVDHFPRNILLTPGPDITGMATQ